MRKQLILERGLKHGEKHRETAQVRKKLIMKRILLISVMLVALLLGACAPVTTPTPEPTPATFTISDLSIYPAEINAGERIIISVLATNDGDLAGNYQITFKINNVTVETVDIHLAGGDTKKVDFATAVDYVPGTYSVDVNGLLGTFTVKPPAPVPVDGSMQVYFFDVGQADATLLLGPDFTVLIDAGDYRRNDVVPHLESVGVKEVDLLIGTHPHADHIGQFPQVLEIFPVKEVWLSGDIHTARTFERAIDAIEASGAAYHEPRAGELFQFGSLHIKVLNPDRLTGDFHEGSVSIRAVFGDVAFIFTGDAETHTEGSMVGRGHNLKAQILQLGHHGSRTSSSQEFLDAVQPEVAIYSAGEGNPYGHPHGEIVNRVLAMGIQLYGTDVHGTIIIETDGTTYSVSTDRAGDIRAPPSTELEPAKLESKN